MKLTKKTCKLIAQLEYIIGDTCYNPKSHNGWTGEDGLYYRYPVTIEDTTTNEKYKFRGKIEDLDKDDVQNMYYLFGPNQLRIGVGIKRVLEYLEKYYGLDFNEMKKASKPKSDE